MLKDILYEKTEEARNLVIAMAVRKLHPHYSTPKHKHLGKKRAPAIAAQGTQHKGLKSSPKKPKQQADQQETPRTPKQQSIDDYFHNYRERSLAPLDLL